MHNHCTQLFLTLWNIASNIADYLLLITSLRALALCVSEVLNNYDGIKIVRLTLFILTDHQRFWECVHN